MIDDRYQNQKWYIRLWRRRYYITVPLVALRIWIPNIGKVTPDGFTYPFSFCWSIAKGLVQTKMKWYYTFDEVEERRKKRRKELRK